MKQRIKDCKAPAYSVYAATALATIAALLYPFMRSPSPEFTMSARPQLLSIAERHWRRIAVVLFLPDLSQMALSWTPAPTPTVDSNPQTCHGKGFAPKKRYHHPFRRCLDPLNTMLLHSSSPDIDPHSAP
jgi:hypothetical protein